MQLFLDSNDFDSELLKLKQRIKNILNECFIDIYLQCHYKTFDFFGNVLTPMEDEFLKFTSGNFIEWCKRTSRLFEFGFESVIFVTYSNYNSMSIELLNIYVDDFFKKDLFNEKWFKCLQCKEFTEYENEGLCYDCELKNYRSTDGEKLST